MTISENTKASYFRQMNIREVVGLILLETLPDTDHLRAPLVRDDLRGFPGSRIRDTHKADSDIDIDGDGE